MTSVTGYSLDDFFQTTNIGSVNKATSNNLYGINHRQIQTAVPENQDTFGYTFFVRPQLNLQSDNIRNLRALYGLLSQDAMTVHRFIRTTLDPRLMTGLSLGNFSFPPISSPLTDNLSAFIPLLTNNLISLSGWPDVVLPTFTSKAGLYNEVYAQADGIVKNYEQFTLNATFRNTREHGVIALIFTWLVYMAAVFEGTLVPYLDFISENEIDYNTRVYRLIMDQTKQYVRKIAACGVAFPTTAPMGAYFDYLHDKVINDQVKEVSVSFDCLGACYNDDILISEFNKTVAIFNPAMSDTYRPTLMTIIDPSLLTVFNNRGYPRINTSTNALEWWVSNSIYSSRSSAILNIKSTSTTKK